MDAVGIVPVDAEIRSGRLKPRQAAHRLIRIGGPGRVGILWHAPDPLNGVIRGDKALHHVHIRAGLVERDIDHLNTKIFRDGKMPVIARHGAQEFHLVKLTPGGISHNAVGHGTGDRIIHHI